jgi:hypothetical protein|tara:strand:+ start:3267 stop:3890 length:624 start_codon:yes stop_codon:yes gene_type:complete
MTPVWFPNVGYLRKKLSSETLKRLQKYIKNKTTKANKTLAGNIKGSYDLIDKDNWFFNRELIPLISEYDKIFDQKQVIPTLLTNDCKFTLNKFWVNYQAKNEFNPLHDHSGIYSFVIWMQISSDYKKEIELPFIKHCNTKNPNSFQFVYTDALGKIRYHNYKLDPSYEGTMLFFPARMNHQVYPHYLSNKDRISISGNISIDPNQPI